ELFLLVDDRADAIGQQINDYFWGIARPIGHRQFGDIVNAQAWGRRNRQQDQGAGRRDSADHQAEFEKRLKIMGHGNDSSQNWLEYRMVGGGAINFIANLLRR